MTRARTATKCVAFSALVAWALAAAVPVSAQESPPEAGGSGVLFVESATRGSLAAKRGSAEKLVLTLEGIDAHALWFTDRPAHRSGHTPIKAALEAIDFGNRNEGPPNAVLSIPGESDRRSMVALTLERPRVAKSGTLRFDASPIADVTGSRLEPYANELDRSVPTQFGKAALFIDSAADPQTGTQDKFIRIYFSAPVGSPAKTVKIVPDQRYQCVDDATTTTFPLSGAGPQTPVDIHVTMKNTGDCAFQRSFATWRVSSPQLDRAPTLIQITQTDAGLPWLALCFAEPPNAYPCKKTASSLTLNIEVP